MSQKRPPISRREFARRAALASAAAAIAPSESLVAQQGPSSPKTSAPPPGSPKLSPASQTEADARFDTIMRQYGSRFSEAQKTDLHRLCSVIQEPLDHLRDYAIQNNDPPALVLKPLVDREIKPAPATSANRLPILRKP